MAFMAFMAVLFKIIFTFICHEYHAKDGCSTDIYYANKNCHIRGVSYTGHSHNYLD